MKSWPTASLRRLLVFRVACFGMLFPAVALAQTTTWDNSNANNLWSNGANWSGNSTPTSTSNVQFGSGDSDGTPSVVNNIELQADRVANNLTFSNVNDNFSLINGSGSRTLTLTSGDISRSGLSSNTQSLSFTTLALGGDAAMNISGSGSLTIASNIVDSGGARSLTKSGTGELILSGANTYSNNTTISAGKLTLASSSALGTGGTLTMSGGTLKLSTATTSLTNLNITGNSTIDFGGANATLNVSNLTISGGFTLSIINWTNAADFFFASNWTGATYDTTGAAPMNQVVFNSPTYTGNDTKWLIYGNHEITPVPEPSTYGALLLATATGLVYWRRRLAGLVGHAPQPQVVKIKAEVGQG